MKFSEFLGRSELTKAEVAERLGISKAAVSKWDDLPGKWESVLLPILEGKEVELEISEELAEVPTSTLGEMTDLECLGFIRCRSKLGDDGIAKIIGCRLNAWQARIREILATYPSSDPFWKQVKSDTDIRK